MSAAPDLSSGRCVKRGNPDDFTNSDKDRAGARARRRAVTVCQSCPVRQLCDRWAAENDFHGVWGGRYRR